MTQQHITEPCTFFSGPHLKLDGLVYKPTDSTSRRPALVLCHGFGGVKEGVLPGLAKALADAGYVVLTFDYRGFGGSEGPAGLLNPDEQVADTLHAIEYLATRADVDPARIGLYGTSFGGGVAARATARSKRVKALGLSVPVMDGLDWLRGMTRLYEFMTLDETSLGALQAKTVSGEIAMVDRFDIMIPDDDSRSKTVGKTPIALETFQHVKAHNPMLSASAISVPTIMFGVRTDQLVTVEQTIRFFEQLRCEKKLHMFDRGTHYSVYDELLADVARLTIDWYGSTL